MSKIFDISQIQIKWVGISIIVFIVAQLVITGAFAIVNLFTLGILKLLLGWLVPLLIYFITGLITGILSPGITIFEPAIGAGLTVTVASLIGLNGRMGLVPTILIAAIAFVLALIGAYIGEKRQLKRSQEA